MKILFTGDFKAGEDHVGNIPFSARILDMFSNADYVIINLEAPLTDRGFAVSKTGSKLRMSPKYANVLKKSGVDCVCIANNHIRDYGDIGVEDTIKHCKEAGLDIVGGGMHEEEARQPLIKAIDSQRVSFLNYCEREFSIVGRDKAGANPYDAIRAFYDVSSLKNKVDRIIVIFHGGLESQHIPTPEMVKAFRYLVDLGADAVISHHMHAYSGYELYKGKPIYYGLGNFYFYKSKIMPSSWYNGFIVDLVTDVQEISSSTNYTYYDKENDMVDLANDSDVSNIDDHLVRINGVIHDKDAFAAYWNEQHKKMKKARMRQLLCKTKLSAKFSQVSGIAPILTSYQLNTVKNFFSCDTHRNVMEAILQDCYDDRNTKGQ